MILKREVILIKTKRSLLASIVIFSILSSTFSIITGLPFENSSIIASINDLPLFSEGNGTEENPYLISNVTELQNMKNDIYAHYELKNDIDAFETRTWNGGKGFEPIVPDQSEGNGVGGSKFFGGTLEGNGYSINSLYIKSTEEEGASFLGLTMRCRIANVSLEDCNITGSDMVGGFSGITFPEITFFENCRVSGIISGQMFIGGIAGHSNGGNFIKCSANVTISGSYSIGGIVGDIDKGSIIDCYSTGSFTGTSEIGGILGHQEGSDIRNSYYNVNNTLINGRYQLIPYGIYESQFNDWMENDLNLNINDYFSFDTTSGNYEISSTMDIKNILPFAVDPSLGFIQTSDIDMKNEVGLFIPIMLADYDGAFHKIRNMNLLENSNQCLGFFGLVGEYGNRTVISNVVFQNASVKKSLSYGFSGAIGYLNIGSKLENITTDGSFRGYYCGGLLGFNWFGVIRNCSSSGDINGNVAGGLIGQNYGGFISDCCFTGEVWSEEDGGGFSGSLYYSSGISHCYVSADVRGNGNKGAFTGIAYETGFNSCFWDDGRIGPSYGVGFDKSDPQRIENGTRKDHERGIDLCRKWVGFRSHLGYCRRSFIPFPQVLL